MRTLRTVALALFALLATASLAQADTWAAACPIEAACGEPGGGGEVPAEIELQTETSDFTKSCMSICRETFGDAIISGGAGYNLSSCRTFNLVLFRVIACVYRRV